MKMSDADPPRREETTPDDANPYSSSAEPLSSGLLNSYAEPLGATRRQLVELVGQQDALVDRFHDDNLRLAELLHSTDTQAMFTKVDEYRDKMVRMRREMRELLERTGKLKKRAERLTARKCEEGTRWDKIQREIDLIGRGEGSSKGSTE